MKEESASREDGLPTYEESSATQFLLPSSQTSLPQHLSATRNARISQLFNTEIYPYLCEQALSGLAQSTLILVPSTTTALQPAPILEGKATEAPQFPGETIVGFPSENHVTLVRLRGEENALEFWKQPSVIRELGSHVRVCLRDTGHNVSSAEDDIPVISPPPDRSEPSIAKRGLFGWKSRTSSDAVSPTLTSEWRIVVEKPLSEGEVRIKVAVQDVSLRTASDLGLYETRTGKAIVIRIEVGT